MPQQLNTMRTKALFGMLLAPSPDSSAILDTLLERPDLQKTMTEALARGDHHTRLEAAQVLGEIRLKDKLTPETLQALADQMVKDKEWDVQVTCCINLLAIEPEERLQPLFFRLLRLYSQDNHPAENFLACVLTSTRAYKQLGIALGRPEFQAGAIKICLLSEIPPEEAQESGITGQLLKIARDENATARWSAAYCLLGLHPDAPKEPLISTAVWHEPGPCGRPVEQERRKRLIEEGLPNIKRTEILQAIAAIRKDSSPEIAQACLRLVPASHSRV